MSDKNYLTSARAP